MYFLRWITSHPILSIVLVTLIYALTNYQNLYHWFSGTPHGAAATQAEAAHSGASTPAADPAKAAASQPAPAAAPSSETSVAKAEGVAQPQGAAAGAASSAVSQAAGANERPKSLFDFLRRDRAASEAPAAGGQPTDVAQASKPEVAATSAGGDQAAAASGDGQHRLLGIFARRAATPSDAAQVASAPAQAAGGEAPKAEPVASAPVAEAPKTEQAPAVGAEAPKVEQPAPAPVTVEAPKAAEPAAVSQGGEKESSLFAFFRKKPEAATSAAAQAPAAGAAQPEASGTQAPAPASAPVQAEQATSAPAQEPKSWLDFLKRETAPATPEPAVAQQTPGAAPGAAAPAEAHRAPETPQQAAGAPAPTAAVATAAAPVAEQPVAAAPAPVTQPVQVAVPAPAQQMPAPIAKAEKPAAQTGSGAPQPGAPASVGDTRESQLNAAILDARQAFWRRDYAAAETIYRNLVTAEPNNPDVLGEFGNMLVQSGKAVEAVDVYAKAANLLIEQKRYRDAYPLVGFIAHLDRDRARALSEKLRAAP